MEIDAAYTFDDHQARDNDAYALTKYRITLSWLTRFGMTPGERVLNVGAGSGLFSEMSALRGYPVTNIEPDNSAADIAEARLGSNSVIRTDIVDYRPKEKFRVVVMHDILEHIEDDLAALRAIHSLLDTQRSIFIGSVPAWNWLYGYHDEQLGHFRRYSPKTLRQVLTPSFQVVTMRQLGVLGIPAALWYSRMRGTAYPVGAGGLAERVFSVSCRLEEHVCMPVGSSLLWACTPRQ